MRPSLLSAPAKSSLAAVPLACHHIPCPVQSGRQDANENQPSCVFPINLLILFLFLLQGNEQIAAADWLMRTGDAKTTSAGLFTASNFLTAMLEGILGEGPENERHLPY